MEHLKLKLDPSEIDQITDTIRKTIREEAKSIVKETLAQQEESTIFYTTEETAQKLGCSVPTLRLWRKSGKINAHKMGVSYMFSAEAIAEAHRIGLKYRR